MAITINGSGITSANIADGTIVNADVNDVAASKLTGALPAISGASLTGIDTGGTGSAVRASKGDGDQSVGAGYAKITLTTEEFDVNNEFSSSRFTPTVAGYYLITGQYRMEANANGTMEHFITITKNGTHITRGLNEREWGAEEVGSIVSQVIYLNGASDYIELYAYSSVASRSLRSGQEYCVFTSVFIRGV